MKYRFFNIIILVLLAAILTSCDINQLSEDSGVAQAGSNALKSEVTPIESELGSYRDTNDDPKENSTEKNNKESESTENTEKTDSEEPEKSEESEKSEEPETSDTSEKSENSESSNQQSDDQVEENTPKSVKIEEYSAVLYAKKNVNIRKEASSKCERIGVLNKGEAVEVTGLSDNGWYRIHYNGEEAFISVSYLITEEAYQEQRNKEIAESEKASEQESVQESEQTTPPDENENGGSTGETQNPSPVSTDYKQTVVDLMNQKRSDAGIPAIELSDALSAAAQKRAGELEASFSHDRPDGSSCFTILTENGIAYMTAGENIAAGQQNPEAVMDAWMNSEGHRTNILSPSFGHVGIGVYYSQTGYGIYWVQLFTD